MFVRALQAEGALEVRVHLEDLHADAAPGEEQTQDHARRPPRRR